MRLAVLDQRISKKPMKKSRGTGLVYRPTYVDKGTGERKAASTWWIQYSVRGRRFRESSGSRNRTEAEKLLQVRLEAAAQGKPVGPSAGKATFEHLAQILLDDYRVNARSSLERVDDALGHLRGFFDGVHAVEITSDRIASYISWRQEQGAASATINRELAALRRAFRLAQKAGMVAFRPEISTLHEENQPKGFFEADQYRAVLENLPEYLKPVIQTAYITGWRIKSEILSRQKQHLDLQSGCLKLDREETGSGEERKFPLTPGMRELLVRQLEEVNELERKTGRIIPWLFHHNGKPIKDFRKAWALACQRAGIVGKVPHDFRRTAVRNLERAGISRSAAMVMVGHRTDSIYQRYKVADEAMLKASATKLAALHESEKSAPGSERR
jgi:integrase